MVSRIILPILIFWTIASGCSEKCEVVCNASLTPVAVNYTADELDTVIVNYYTADNSFSHLVSSTTTVADSAFFSLWKNIFASNGSLAPDSLSNGKLLADFTYTPYDIEVIIPSNNNKAYRFSKITFIGYSSENQFCREGSPTPGFCARMLASYELNGTLISHPNINSYTGSNYIYFEK